MSVQLPNFRRPGRSGKPYTSEFTDSTRHGSAPCPYCGGYHSKDSEIDACARAHSYQDEMYRCPRCGQRHNNLGEANTCCDQQKRFDRKYDPETYYRYTEGPYLQDPYSYGTGVTTDDSVTNDNSWDWLLNAGGNDTTDSSSSSGGGWSAYLNAGSKEPDSKPASSDGFFSSFLNFGGK